MTTLVETAPTTLLMNGVVMPRLGLGTWPMDDAEAAEAVRVALQSGYRLVDTAENYRNEEGVGQGIRAAGLPREEVFVTTKFNKEWHSVEGVRQACEASLKRLGLDYIDLYLVHWPNPGQGRYVQAVEGLMRVMEEGLVRSIGTCNFLPSHMQDVFDAGFVPHVNQIQLDPYHARAEEVELHAQRGIITESWSPIGRGGALLEDPVIVAAATRLGVTPAQAVLRWHLQKGYLPVPKSSNPTRMAQNLDVFRFELSAEEMAAFDALDRPDPNMLDANSFGH